MKKNVRNALAISGLALAMGTSAFTLEASANNGQYGRIQRSHQERIVRTRKTKDEKTFTGRHNFVGVVTEIGENSLTITKGLKTYTVNISADTRILDNTWQKIDFSTINKESKIRVFGKMTDSTIAAKTIRVIK